MSSIEPSTQFKALGQKIHSTELEVILLKEELDVSFTSDEVTAVCPVTGQPDQYKVTISIQESAKSIESKSLKLYLQSFRNQGIFAENLALTIKNAVLSTLGNVALSVVVEQKSRGGITLRASAFKHKYYTDVEVPHNAGLDS